MATDNRIPMVRGSGLKLVDQTKTKTHQDHGWELWASCNKATQTRFRSFPLDPAVLAALDRPAPTRNAAKA